MTPPDSADDTIVFAQCPRCDGCAIAERVARDLGDPSRWVPCLACGTQWQATARVTRTQIALRRPPRAPSRPDSIVERRRRQCLHELLAWSATVERAERNAIAGGARSAWVRNVLLAPDGRRLVLGDGCKGTKGTGRAPERDPIDVTVDPVAQGRYDALVGPALRCADEVIADGQGDQLVELAFGAEGRPRLVALTLAVRLGLRLATSEQARAWFAKFAVGDSPPAIKGADAVGEAGLSALVAAWFPDAAA